MCRGDWLPMYPLPVQTLDRQEGYSLRAGTIDLLGVEVYHMVRQYILVTLTTGNLTPNLTAALGQCGAAWGQSLQPMNWEPVIATPVIPVNI